MTPGGYGGPPGGGPGAPQQPGPYGAPQQPGAYGAPQQPGGYGAPQPGAYGAPQQQPGAYGAQQPGAYPGQMPGAPQQGMMGAQPGMMGAPQQGMMGAQPGMMGAQPGMMGAPAGGLQNPYGAAQNALKTAGGTMKMMQYGFIGLGALLVLGGIVMLITVGIGEGLGMLITGVVLAGTAFFVLPQFSSMVGSATSQVNALAQKAQLAQTGLPAMGRLLQVQQTGTLVNFNPEVRALVEVQHPQMGTYQVQTTAVIPQISIPQFQPGAQVQVRINPQNPQDIALVV